MGPALAEVHFGSTLLIMPRFWVSPTVGNFSEMIPSLVQASQLKKILPESLVTYVS